MIEKDTEQEFINTVKAAFDRSVAGLDAGVSAELRRIRQHALGKKSEKSHAWILYSAGAVGTACLAILIYSFTGPATTPQPFSAEDIEVLSTTENLDLYENLEFYEWLADDAGAG